MPQTSTIRVGHFPNITHVQGLVAHHLTRHGRGWFEQRLGPGVKIEWFVYNALTREQLYGDIQRIWASHRKTIILVTHNVREAVCLGDRVTLMSGSPGRIREEVPIPLPRPRDINSAALSSHAAQITAALKGYMAGEVAE